MSWIMEGRLASESEPAAPWDETVINGTPYETCKTTRPAPAAPTPTVEQPDTRFAEELKRRQFEAMRGR